jgi:hypothetical protein
MEMLEVLERMFLSSSQMNTRALQQRHEMAEIR